MRFIVRRAGFYLLAFFSAIVINFVLPRMLPGDPASIMLSQATQLTSEQVEAMRVSLGLTNDPLPLQFWTYLTHAVQGDFGISYSYYPSKVTTVISNGIGWTLLLGLTSLLIAFFLGNILGTISAWRRGSVVDNITPPLLMFIGAFPPFFLALSLLFVLALGFGWFPTAHSYDTSIVPGWTGQYIGSVLYHLILPATVALLVSLGGWALGMRNVMMGVLGEDYITLAEAKGLRTNRLMAWYAARNALLPGITGFGTQLGFILSGQILIEQVFAYPGLGYQLISAVGNRDYPLMQGLFLMITVAVLLANFLVDILYVRLDPRVRNT
jgi:peptide/nickel transport system permease protein